MTRVAAVDIGTNSTRLLVADVDGTGRDAQLRHGRPAHADHPARPGRRRDRGGSHPDAIERTLAVLREYRDVDRRRSASTRVRATATSASRDATNRDDFFDPAEQLLGVRPELLSGRGRGRASSSSARPPGSTEPGAVPRGRRRRRLDRVHRRHRRARRADLGRHRLRAPHRAVPALATRRRAEELSQAVSVVRDHLADVDREVPGRGAARRR